MARNYPRDYQELPEFAKKYAGKTALECIEAYAKNRKVVSHRISAAFWDLVDSKEITIIMRNGIAIINKEDD